MDLDQIVADAQKAFEDATDVTTLENEKARFLGKSGALTELLKGLGKLDPDTRKTEGARINIAKQQVEGALTARRQALADALLNQRPDIRMKYCPLNRKIFPFVLLTYSSPEPGIGLYVGSPLVSISSAGA